MDLKGNKRRGCRRDWSALRFGQVTGCCDSGHDPPGSVQWGWIFWVSGELLACQGMSVSCSRHAALPSLVGAFPVRNAMPWWPDCTKWNQSTVHQLYRSLSDDRLELAFEIFCNLRLEEWHKQLNLSVLFKYRPSLWTIVNWKPILT